MRLSHSETLEGQTTVIIAVCIEKSSIKPLTLLLLLRNSEYISLIKEMQSAEPAAYTHLRDKLAIVHSIC